MAEKMRMSAEEFRKKFGKSPRIQKKKVGKTGSMDSSEDAFTRLCYSYLGAECVKEYKFCSTRRWRFDYCIPTAKIAIEVEGGVWTGGRHINPQGFLNDMEKYNQAALMGYRLFRTTPDDLLTTKFLDLVKTAITDGDKN